MFYGIREGSPMTTARTRTHASPGVAAVRKHAPPPAPSGAGGAPTAGHARLPWWAAVLPVLAFAMLLALLLGGGEASAAEQHAGGDVVAEVLKRVAQALLG
jgi:hypothetical protein